MEDEALSSSQGQQKGLLDQPFELLVYLLSFLDVRSLNSLSCTSRAMHQVATDRVVWKQLCYQHFGPYILTHDLKVEELKQKVEQRKKEKKEAQEKTQKKAEEQKADGMEEDAEEKEEEEEEEEENADEDEEKLKQLDIPEEEIEWPAMFKFLQVFWTHANPPPPVCTPSLLIEWTTHMEIESR